MSIPKEFFSVSIVSCDSYQNSPSREYDDTYSQFAGRQVDLVPIIRIFGVTPSGQKTCVHVHGTFPYISVEYEGSDDQAKGYSRQFASSLEKALNRGSKNPRQHVHNVTFFRATPFYGYHKNQHSFLRIQFYSVLSLKRSVELLHSGSIMNQSIQPYEAHIPYVLQFCIDYNLFGMNMLRLSKVAFRPPPEHGFLTSSIPSSAYEMGFGPGRIWNVKDLDNKYLVSFPRQSTCELECDCNASDILNNMLRNASANPGLADIWEDERQRHKDEFNMSKITPLSSQERSQTDITRGEKILLLSWKEKLRNLEKISSNSQLEVSLEKDKLDDSDIDFIEAMAQMLGSQESDSILNTQHSRKSIPGSEHDVSDSDEDEKETLEMSQILHTSPLRDQTTFRIDDILPDESDRIHSTQAPVKELSNIEVVDVHDSGSSCGGDNYLDMTEIFSYDFSDVDDVMNQSEGRDDDVQVVNAEVVSSGSNLQLSGQRLAGTPDSNIVQLDGAHEDSDSDFLDSDDYSMPSLKRRKISYSENSSNKSNDLIGCYNSKSSNTKGYKKLRKSENNSDSSSGHTVATDCDPKNRFSKRLKKSETGNRTLSCMVLRNRKKMDEHTERKTHYPRRSKNTRITMSHCYTQKELLESLPREAFQVILKHNVSISRNIATRLLKSIGREKLFIQRCDTHNSLLTNRNKNHENFSLGKQKENLFVNRKALKSRAIEPVLPSSKRKVVENKDSLDIFNRKRFTQIRNNSETSLRCLKAKKDNANYSKLSKPCRTRNKNLSPLSPCPIPSDESPDKSPPCKHSENSNESDDLTQIVTMSPNAETKENTDLKTLSEDLTAGEKVSQLHCLLGVSSKAAEDRDTLFNLSFMSPSNSLFSSSASPLNCLSPTDSTSSEKAQNSSNKLISSNSSQNFSNETHLHENQPALVEKKASSLCETKVDKPDLSRNDIILPHSPNVVSDSSSRDSCCLNLSLSSEDSKDFNVISAASPSDAQQIQSLSSYNSVSSHNSKQSQDTPSVIQLSQSTRDDSSNHSKAISDLRSASPEPSPIDTLVNSPEVFDDSHILSFYDCLDVSSESANVTLVDSPKNPELSCRVLTYPPPPTRSELEGDLKNIDGSSDSNILNQNKDLKYNTKISELEEFRSIFYTDHIWKSVVRDFCRSDSSTSKMSVVTPVVVPPSRATVETWCKKNKLNPAKPKVEAVKVSPLKKAMSKISKESTASHDLEDVDLSEVKGRRLSNLRRRLFRERVASPAQCELDQSHSSESSAFLNTTDNQVNLTPKRFNESFSMIEGHCPAETSHVVIPSAQEKFHTSKTHAQPLTLLSMELHVPTKGDLRPNPAENPIQCLFYCLHRYSCRPDIPIREAGFILVSTGSPSPSDANSYLFSHLGTPTVSVSEVLTERDLLLKFIELLHRSDPDIVVGYEIERQSWGYLLERWSSLEPSLCTGLSRIPELPKTGSYNHQQIFGFDPEEQGSDYLPDIVLPGRIVLNVWKIMRFELALTSYTFENVSYQVLNQRVPKYSYKMLTELFQATKKQQLVVFEYYLQRAIGSVDLLEHFNIVGRTSELARILGIQFFEVLSRGSQFRVESVMLRLTQSRGFLPVTCSQLQRAHSRAPECVQLILEPNSRLYTDPVVVLDFQSLYPSIIIAHNYCYSTCLGRLEHLGKSGPFDFGCTLLGIPPESLNELEDLVTISPNGVVFVKPEVRTGVLPTMLQEILNTRIMVKQSMKKYKDNKALTKLLDARQLGLKLIANVTYGYTGANFSGRMPCVELSDSILSKSRETLQNAINFVENKWKVSVVYGDTDSMFVHLPGRTKDEAFKIGQEMADAVTAMSPKPVKLKFEKVYLPCILQTKKRYVGFMYETPEQKDPVLDAKGIETVRRDNCPAVGKILEKSLRLLFRHLDISLVESYVKRQFQKIFGGRASMQDLIFAKEYRGKARYRPGACVPALEIANRVSHVDPRSEPLCGERVPYVIVYGPPGLPLIKLVRQPQELLLDPSLKLNSIYYVTRVIAPPLDRMFALMGVNVHKWIQELPRVLTEETTWDGPSTGFSAHSGAVPKASLSQYFARVDCLLCGNTSDSILCLPCRAKPQAVLVSQGEKYAAAQRKSCHLLQVCQSCSGLPVRKVPCISLDCPITFQTVRSQNDVHRTTHNFNQVCNLLKLSW